MTQKRFKLRLSKLGNGMITDTQKRDDLYFDKEFLDATLPKATEWLNELAEENKTLKTRFKEERELAMRLSRECDTLTIKNQKLGLEIIRLETIIKVGDKE